MAEKITPFLLTETGCLPWQKRTLRQLGKDEHFLEEVIGKNPRILGLEDRRTQLRGEYARFHQRPLKTPLGKLVYPDIVFLCESGHIVIVEVKLADNSDLKDRSVIEQVLDYASSLAAYTEEKIVKLFGEAKDQSFVDVVRTKFPNTEDPEELAERLLGRMRSAELHLVIACDGAPDGLREFVRGVTNQSALGGFELRVVELVPYTIGDHSGMLLLPAMPVRTEIVARTAVNVTYEEGQPKVNVVVSSLDEMADEFRRAQSGVVKEMRMHPALAAVVSAYDEIAVQGLGTSGRAWHYCQIKPNDWPSSLHYEFLSYNRNDNDIGVELHLENKDVKPIAKFLEPLAGQLQSKFSNIAWDPKWGRLVLRMRGATPSVVAETMKRFIAETRPVVDKALAEMTATPYVL
ncbi:MAG: hypothetical protein FWD69_06690 [Polyangiaceae bacterium]|nr:hypothetical protein [Polyangiaceae bacterium]